MRFKVNILIFIGLTFSMTSFTSSAKIDYENPFNHAKTCFRKPFSTFEEWLSVIEQGSTKRFKEEDKIKQSIANFKARFPEALFRSNKESTSCETFFYKSGEGVVDGFLIKPKNVEGKLPVIIYNRGGNGKYGRVNLANMFGTLFPLSQKGFIVIGSQYRGSSRKNNPSFDDQFGGEDVQDVLNLAKLIPAIDNADLSKVAMLGASRGAMQSYLALKAGLKVKALATFAGNTDLKTGLNFRAEMENVYKKRIPNYQSDGSAALLSRSALYWIDKLDPELPILLIHGEKDTKVHAFHSIKMAEKLNTLGRPHKLVLYPEDNHGLSINRTLAINEVSDWFIKHL